MSTEYKYLIDKLPISIIVIGALGFIIWKFLLPVFKTWLESKEIMTLRERVVELETELEEVKTKYASLFAEHKKLEGIVQGFRVYLKANGFEDFPDVEHDE